jgi:hypothetical protein
MDTDRAIGFYMAFAGGILQIIASTALVLVATYTNPMDSIYADLGWNAQLMGSIGLVFGFLVLAGAISSARAPYGGNRKTVIGSAVVVFFSVLNIFFSGGGFIIGFILGVVGGGWGYVSTKPDYSAS